MTEAVAVLHERDRLPEGFLHAGARDLHRLLPGPTLIHLPGARSRPLFVVLLQHGNETSGLAAVQRLLAAHEGRTPPRALSLFIANVAAAREGTRRLAGQPDYNRCWPGTEEPACPETEMMSAVVEAMRPRAPLAAVDLHNTSGSNPLHAGINVLDDRALQLAARFASTAVHFTRPRGALPAAFAGLCPALLLECGTPGDPAGVAAATGFLEQCLALDEVPAGALPPGALALFGSTALVFIPESVRFAFDDAPDADLVLHPGIDDWNFVELTAGTALGRVYGEYWPVRALAPDGREITAELFEIAGSELRLRRTLMPGLLTADADIIRQDCLCHLMQRLPLPA